jgi:hypothetical protein
VLVISGCGGSNTGTVRGTVLHADGSPLAGARVVARSAETGETAYGTTDADGSFELGGASGDGVPPGDYDVIVLEDRGDPDSRQALTVAAKYRDPEKSGLAVSVQSGELQQLNFTLDPP